MKVLILLALLTMPLGGCALFAAGFIGFEIERHNHDWCWRHYHNPHCGYMGGR